MSLVMMRNKVGKEAFVIIIITIFIIILVIIIITTTTTIKVGKEAWLLEALVVSMELYLESAQSGAAVTVMANGLRCSAGGSQVLAKPLYQAQKSGNSGIQQRLHNSHILWMKTVWDLGILQQAFVCLCIPR